MEESKAAKSGRTRRTYVVLTPWGAERLGVTICENEQETHDFWGAADKSIGGYWDRYRRHPGEPRAFRSDPHASLDDPRFAWVSDRLAWDTWETKEAEAYLLVLTDRKTNEAVRLFAGPDGQELNPSLSGGTGKAAKALTRKERRSRQAPVIVQAGLVVPIQAKPTGRRGKGVAKAKPVREAKPTPTQDELAARAARLELLRASRERAAEARSRAAEIRDAKATARRAKLRAAKLQYDAHVRGRIRMTDSPSPPGEFFSHAGPRDGPIHDGDVPGSIGVHDRPDAPDALVGIAHSVTQVQPRHKSVMVFRLVVHKQDVLVLQL